MDRSTARFSFISVLLAVIFTAVFCVIAILGVGASGADATTALAEPNLLQEGDLMVAGLDMVTAAGNTIGAGPGSEYAGTIKSGSAALTYGEDGNPVLTLNNFVYVDQKDGNFMSQYSYDISKIRSYLVNAIVYNSDLPLTINVVGTNSIDLNGSYSANFIQYDAVKHGKNGICYPKNGGLCFEAQHYPDAPNHPHFPSVVLRPTDTYTQTTIYRFTHI